ncbi:MAG TPA: hypothetical protein VII59_00290 [Streptosporangiaceae bacterium]
MRTRSSRPRGATTTPTVPSTSAGSANLARSEDQRLARDRVRATDHRVAARGQRRTVGPAGDIRGQHGQQGVQVTAAGRRENASTTCRWRPSSGAGTAGAPRTRCRARLASFFAAAGVRPTTGAIWSSGYPGS